MGLCGELCIHFAEFFGVIPGVGGGMTLCLYQLKELRSDV